MIWTFIFIVAALIGTAEGGNYIRIANCNCSVNNNYLDLTKCDLRALSREKVTTTVEFALTKEAKNATIHFHIRKMTSTGRYFPYLYDIWANVCQVVRESPNTNFIIKQVKRIMAKYSNAVRCGHKPGLYYFRDVELRYEVVKFLFDTGRYIIFIEFYEGLKNQYLTLGNYTIVVDILEKFSRPKNRDNRNQRTKSPLIS